MRGCRLRQRGEDRAPPWRRPSRLTASRPVLRNVQPYHPVLRETVRWSILIVAGLVAIGIAASVDALRGEQAARRLAEPEATTGQTTTQRTASPRALTAAGVTGTLYYTLQVEDGCELHMLALPRLTRSGAFVIDSCEFDVSPQGNIATGPSCPGDGVQAGPPGGTTRSRTKQRFSGCAPAWRPDGELTFIRHGDVVTAGGEVLVRDLARAGRPWFSRRKPVTVRALAWLTETRLAAILRGR